MKALFAKINPAKIFISLLIASTLIFLAHYLIVGNGIWGDGRYYYAFTRSWVIDKDIDFSNERLVDPFYFDDIPTPIGRVGNKYSIGTPILWLPSFIAAHAISLIAHLINPKILADGYGHIYRIFIGVIGKSFHYQQPGRKGKEKNQKWDGIVHQLFSASFDQFLICNVSYEVHYAKDPGQEENGQSKCQVMPVKHGFQPIRGDFPAGLVHFIY